MFLRNSKTYQLLKPHVRPRLLALAGIFVLASIASFGQKAPILLLDPLWRKVLFPVEEASVEASPGRASESQTLVWLRGRFAGLEERAEAWFESGSPAAPADPVRAKRTALFVVAVVLVVTALLTAIAQYFFVLLSRWVGLRLVVDLRLRLARHLMGLSMRYHSQRRFGDLLSRISNDVHVTLQVIDVFMKDIVEQPLMILVSFGAAYAVAPLPTLVALIGLPLLALPISVLGRRVRKKSKKSLRALGASLEVLTQMFRGIRTVKAFRAEERELQRYRDMNDQYLGSAMKMVTAMAKIQGLTIFLSYAGFALLVVFVGWFVLHGKGFASGSEMMVFFVTISMVFTHIRRVTSGVNKIQESMGASERLLQLLAEPSDIVESPDPRPITGIAEGLRFRGVTFQYPNTETPALAGLDITLRRGETLALVGPSGAGKTTTIDLIARFLDPTEGSIEVDGVDLRELEVDGWTAQFALVGQDPFLFHDTVAANIGYGRPGASQAEIEEAARAAHIHDFVASLPEGYRTVVGDDGARLSGGQRQRITIARAILKGAPLLLLDEATSALDSESEAEVQAALDRLVEDRTVVVIAHRLSTVRRADRICVLERGRLVGLGTHEELLAQGGLYRKLYEMQFGDEAPAGLLGEPPGAAGEPAAGERAAGARQR